MIIDSLIEIVVALFRAILGLLPEWSLTLPETGSAFQFLGGAVRLISGYFPVYVLFVCVGIYLAARLFFSSWSLIVWLYEKFPFKAT